MHKSVLMKWLSWNIRGLGSPEKMKKIRKLLANRKIDMALFQETKKESLSSVDVKRLWPRDNLDFMAVDAEGRAGGLLCIWDPDVFQLSDCCSNRSYLLLVAAVVLLLLVHTIWVGLVFYQFCLQSCFLVLRFG